MPKKTQFKSDDKKKETLKFAQQIVEKAKKDKDASKVMDNYKRSIRYYKGQHHITNRSKAKGNHVFNKYAEIFTSNIGHIVSQIPRWKYRPMTEKSIITSDSLNQFMRDMVWERDGWFEKSEECMISCSHAGSDFIFTDVDDDGWPTFEHMQIGAVLWDKQKRYKDLKYLVRVIKKGVKEIKNEYGVDVLPETEMALKFDVEKGYEVTSSEPYKGPAIMDADGNPDWTLNILGDAYIYEIWLEDKEQETIPFDKKEIAAEHELIINLQEVPAIDHPRFSTKEAPVSIHQHQNHPEHVLAHTDFLKTLEGPAAVLLQRHIEDHYQFPMEDKRDEFPYGRVLRYCQNELLDDTPNKMAIHWRDRWIKWDWEIMPDEFIGKNLGCDLFDPQDALNHRKNSIMMNINMMNNGILKVARGAYKALKSNLSKFTNRIGAVMEVSHKDDVTVDYGQPLPSSTFSDLTHTEMFMNGIGRNRDVAQGQMPAAGTPNSAIQTLLGEYYKTIGGAVRHYAVALQKVARNASVIMREYLPESTVVELSDKSDIVQKQWREIKDLINEENITIDMESFNATSRQEKFKEAIELYREGLFLRKHALMYLDNPDKYQIIQETDELDAAKQQIAILNEELDSADKEINTMRNRLQTDKGAGNVGTK